LSLVGILNLISYLYTKAAPRLAIGYRISYYNCEGTRTMFFKYWRAALWPWWALTRTELQVELLQKLGLGSIFEMPSYHWLQHYYALICLFQ